MFLTSPWISIPGGKWISQIFPAEFPPFTNGVKPPPWNGSVMVSPFQTSGLVSHLHHLEKFKPQPYPWSSYMQMGPCNGAFASKLRISWEHLQNLYLTMCYMDLYFLGFHTWGYPIAGWFMSWKIPI